MRPTVVSGGGCCNVSDSIQLLPSPKDPSMGEVLKCAEAGLRSAENRAPQRVWEVLARILEENPFPLGANIHESPSFDSLWSKGNP